MNAIQPDDYFAAVESRFDSPSPYGRREITVEAPKHVCECGKAFDTEQGLRVHKGRAHSKPDTAPEQKVNPGEEPLPDYEAPCEICGAPSERARVAFLCDECYEDGHVTLRLTPDYRMELIETLAELAMWQVHLDDGGAAAEATLARIKAVVRS